MQHYRNQPQAASHVYRSVLLKSSCTESVQDPEQRVEMNQPPPTPTRMANTSTVGTDGVERGDLIKFYNTGIIGFFWTIVYFFIHSFCLMGGGGGADDNDLINQKLP